MDLNVLKNYITNCFKEGPTTYVFDVRSPWLEARIVIEVRSANWLGRHLLIELEGLCNE